jgi:hypothetical protein
MNRPADDRARDDAAEQLLRVTPLAAMGAKLTIVAVCAEGVLLRVSEC